MLVNKRRRRTRRMPPALAAYWAGKRRSRSNPKRRRRARRNPPVLLNPRRRSTARRSSRRGRSFVGGLKRSFSTAGIMDAGWIAFGMVAPSIFTDRLLPMIGLVLTGWTRRAAQLAVPLGVQAFAPGLLGNGTSKFVAGGLGVCALGVVNDLTGNMPGMVGGYRMFPQSAPRGSLAGYMSNRGGAVPAGILVS